MRFVDADTYLMNTANTLPEIHSVLERISFSSMSMWKKRLIAVVIGFALFAGLVSRSQAFQGYNVVVTTDPTTEANFLSAMTEQFDVTATSNPFVSNTYQINLYGLNPSYNAPPAPPSTLEESLSLGATVYLYGYRDGAWYDQKTTANIAEDSVVNCSTPPAGSQTWDIPTCQATAQAIYDAIYQLSLSTPTPIAIPPEP